MKKLLLVFLLSFIVLRIYSQVAYYDAIKLSSDTLFFEDKNSTPLVFKNNDFPMETLVKYAEGYVPGSSLTKEQIIKSFTGNPFIVINEDGFNLEDSDISGKDSKMGGLGGLDVTTFSRGLSQFLVSRAKAELNVAFFERFKRFFDKEENKDFKILFQNTINCIGDDFLANEYPEMLPVLQAAFQADLNRLPDGIVNLIISKMDENSSDDQYVLAVLSLFKQLKYIEHNSPPDFIEKLPEIFVFDGDPELNKELKTIQSIFQISKELSLSLRTDTYDVRGIYWQNSKDIYDNILKDEVTTKIYLGLLYQKIKNVKIHGDTTIADYINQVGEGETNESKIKKEMLWYTSLVSSFSNQVETVNYLYKSVKAKNDNNTVPDFDEYYSYLTTIIGLTQFGVDVASHYTNTDGIQSYLAMINDGTKVYEYTLSKQYNLAIYHAISLIEFINEKSGMGINDTALSGLKTYGTFIGNVAVAKTPDEVEKSIEAVALPVGSSSVKKYNKNNLAIQAYLGPNFRVWTENNSSSTTWDNTWGITAPVGIGFSLCAWEKGGALTVFLSVLDVGAIVDYELKEGNTDFEQKVYLKNIFSPGGHVVYGFGGNLPLAFGAGIQYGPGLLEINQGDVSIEPSWRASIFLAVDIPVINLYKGKSKR